MRAKFDGICKDLLWELAVSTGFEPIAQFNIDPQKSIEQLLGSVEEGTGAKRAQSTKKSYMQNKTMWE